MTQKYVYPRATQLQTNSVLEGTASQKLAQ